MIRALPIERQALRQNRRALLLNSAALVSVMVMTRALHAYYERIGLNWPRFAEAPVRV